MADAPTIPNKSETRTCFVIPAQAGIHEHRLSGVRGTCGAFSVGSMFMDSRLRGNDGVV
jgi:hypothetical protein